MDNVVYVDHKAGELERLVSGEKTIVIRGATGRKLPYGRVNMGDVLYFIRNNGEGLVRAKAMVDRVVNSARMTPGESKRFVDEHAAGLQLSDAQYKKWAGKRYLVLITVFNVEDLEPFKIDRSGYRKRDDWLPVGDIDSVKV
ncbi:hypothetical protein HOJ44_00160 [Candidatus Bathyarchaeota archaeon]|nr:hypothetical protein [Candidatus Bathyarchaeota archaeon]